MSDDGRTPGPRTDDDRTGIERPDDGPTAHEPPWLTLERGETVDWVGGPRIQSASPWIALGVVVSLGVVGAVALEVVSPLALGVLALVAFPAVWATLRISRTAYAITSQRIAIRTGVLGISVTTVGTERVQNTTVSQHPLGTLIGYGTITIETASGTELTFRNVDAPNAVRERIDRRRDRTTSSDVPGSREDWLAVREEVRGWRRALERRG